MPEQAYQNNHMVITRRSICLFLAAKSETLYRYSFSSDHEQKKRETLIINLETLSLSVSFTLFFQLVLKKNTWNKPTWVPEEELT